MLRKNTSLEVLVLWDNKISAVGVVALAQVPAQYFSLSISTPQNACSHSCVFQATLLIHRLIFDWVMDIYNLIPSSLSEYFIILGVI